MEFSDTGRLKRVLVVMPSWVGDAVMATPTARVLREMLPGAYLGALARPAVADVLDGIGIFDEMHVGRSTGMMGPKRLAAKLKPRRYEAALLLTGSFSTALITRIAGVPRRIGYDRDGRGLLLTERVAVPRRRDVEPFASVDDGRGSEYAPVSAVAYYFRLAEVVLKGEGVEAGEPGPMELAVTTGDELAAKQVLGRGGVDEVLLGQLRREGRMVVLNPGGNRESKRWPVDRWVSLGSYLRTHHGSVILVNGSPGEAALTADIAAGISAGGEGPSVVDLAACEVTLTALKALVRWSRLMVTNDTGPRHIAAALGVPVVSLFGPTDPRWTTIGFPDERLLVADPTLPATEVADDHPERCRIDKIGLGDVVAAANDALRRGRVSL